MFFCLYKQTSTFFLNYSNYFGADQDFNSNILSWFIPLLINHLQSCQYSYMCLRILFTRSGFSNIFSCTTHYLHYQIYTHKKKKKKTRGRNSIDILKGVFYSNRLFPRILFRSKMESVCARLIKFFFFLDTSSSQLLDLLFIFSILILGSIYVTTI